VDAVRAPWIPFAAGAIALVIAAPLTLLPLISATTALVFGIGTAMGTASGVRAIRRAEWASRLLLP
jgi:hypothetical protein